MPVEVYALHYTQSAGQPVCRVFDGFASVTTDVHRVNCTNCLRWTSKHVHQDVQAHVAREAVRAILRNRSSSGEHQPSVHPDRLPAQFPGAEVPQAEPLTLSLSPSTE